jgi:hypothetical protein
MLVASLLGHTSTNIYDAAALEQNDDEERETSHGRHVSFDGKDVNDEAKTDGGGCRQWCFNLTHGERGQYFDDFILVIVCLNTISMASEHHGMDEDFDLFLYVIECIFTAIYVFECSTKTGAIGFKRYLARGINRLDFFIVFAALFGYIVELVMLHLGISQGLGIDS